MEMNTSHFILATTQDVIKVCSTETEGDDQIFQVDMLEYFSVDNQQFYRFFLLTKLITIYFLLISKFVYPDLKGHHSSQNARPCASIIRTSQRTSRTTWSFFLSFFVVVVMAEVSRNHLKKYMRCRKG